MTGESIGNREPSQPVDDQLVAIRNACHERGQTILHEFVGSVREISSGGIFSILYEIGDDGKRKDDRELFTTFKTQAFLEATEGVQPERGRFFYFTIAKADDAPPVPIITLRTIEEFTPEQLAQIRTRAREIRQNLKAPRDESY